jgi:hypothetical protein
MTDPSDAKNGPFKTKELVSIILEDMDSVAYKKTLRHIRLQTLATSNKSLWFENVADNVFFSPPSTVDFRKKSDLEAVRDICEMHDGSTNILADMSIEQVKDYLTDGTASSNTVLRNPHECSISGCKRQVHDDEGV